jgi:hypothetical protein
MSVSTKRSTGVAGNVPVAPARSPTGWWRSIAAPNFHSIALGAMKAALEKVEMLGEPSWRGAVAWPPPPSATAILFDRQKATQGKTDLINIALVICAGEGNAAAVVLSNIIKRLPNPGQRGAGIAASWLARAFRPLADRHLGRG